MGRAKQAKTLEIAAVGGVAPEKDCFLRNLRR
jgi:hypothetical protein